MNQKSKSAWGRVFGVLGCSVLALVGLVLAVPVLFVGGMMLEPLLSRTTTKVVLPTGEIISKVRTTSTGMDGAFYGSQLYFQENGWARSEKLGTEISEPVRYDRKSFSIEGAKLIRNREELLVVAGPYLFKGPVSPDKRYWRTVGSEPDYAAKMFLRSFLNHGEEQDRAERQEERVGMPWANLNPWGLNPDYQFERYDAEQQVLVTRRVSNEAQFPPYLVYGPHYEDEKFDLARTREINGLKPPDDPHLVVDISVVQTAAPVDRETARNRMLVLTPPATATEIFAQTFPLSPTEWNGVAYTLKGWMGKGGYEALFGWWDPRPGYCAILWRGGNVSNMLKDIQVIEPDTWELLEESAGGWNQYIYFRVRKAGP